MKIGVYSNKNYAINNQKQNKDSTFGQFGLKGKIPNGETISIEKITGDLFGRFKEAALLKIKPQDYTPENLLPGYESGADIILSSGGENIHKIYHADCIELTNDTGTGRSAKGAIENLLETTLAKRMTGNYKF